MPSGDARMSGTISSPVEGELSFANLVDRVSRSLGEGEEVDVEQLAAAHPEFAGRLQELMPTLLAMASWGRAELSSCEGGPKPREHSLVSGVIGEFRIIRELGRGGMGTVFEALQSSMGRRVAVKVLPFAALADGRALQRFRNEVRAAAALDHPHIVSVYSVGEDRGIHFYAMQLVRGQSLAEMIWQWRAERSATGEQASNLPSDQSPTVDLAVAARASANSTTRFRLSTVVDSQRESERYRSAARLAVQAADALQHAHEQGVVHRDVKPGNLLVDAEGDLYVTDFGLARIEADAGMTMTGDLVGTLRYMAPEQALAKRVAIDHRADVYSLGVTLYEMLGLQPAFDAVDRSELLKQIAFEDPTPLRKLDRHIPAELETIVGKATEKNPDERYASAGAMADDLRRYMENRPILAKPPTLVDRAAKWSRRHLGVVYTASLLTFLLACVSSLSTVQLNKWYHEAERQGQRAQELLVESRGRQDALAAALSNESAAHDHALESLYCSDMRLAPQLLSGGRIDRLAELLDKHVPAAVSQDRRGWEWYYYLAKCHEDLFTFYAHVNVNGLAMNPNGRTLASVGGENALKLWDLKTYSLLRACTNDQLLRSVDFDPTGERLATGERYGRIRIRDGNTGEILKNLDNPVYDSWVEDVQWSPDGKSLASTQYGVGIHVQNAETGALIKDIPSEPKRHPQFMWDPKSGRFGYADGANIQVFDLEMKQSVAALENYEGGCTSPSWSPDGVHAAWGGWKCVGIGDLTTGKVVKVLQSGRLQERAVRYSPDGKRIAAGNEDGAISVWEPDVSEKPMTILGHHHFVRSIAWTPDGERLVSGSFDGLIRVWDVSRNGDSFQPKTGQLRKAVDWSRNGRRWACIVGKNLDVHVGSANSKKPEAVWENLAARCIGWHPGGELLAVADMEGNVRVREASSGETIHEWKNTGAVRRLRWNADGTLLAIAYKIGGGVNYPLSVRSLLNFDEVARFDEDNGGQAVDVCWAPQGNRLVFCGNGKVRIVDLSNQDAEVRCEMPLQTSGLKISGVDWSPDGARIACTVGNFVWIVDASTGKTLSHLRGHSDNTTRAAWSPDGKRLATASKSETIIWDPETAVELCRINEPCDEVVDLRWRPDGKMLLKLDNTKNLFVCDASKGYEFAAGPLYAIDQAYRQIVLDNDSAAIPRLCELASQVPHRPDIQDIANRLALPTHQKRAIELIETGDMKGARDEIRRVLEIAPDSKNQCLPALVEFFGGDVETGLELLEKLARSGPDGKAAAAEFLNCVAWYLATSLKENERDGKLAVQLATRACEYTDFEAANYIDTLAAAYAESGDFEAAIRWSTKSIELDEKSEFFADQLERFRRKEPSRMNLELMYLGGFFGW